MNKVFMAPPHWSMAGLSTQPSRPGYIRPKFAAPQQMQALRTQTAFGVRCAHVCITAALIAASATAHAQSGTNQHADDTDKPWQEAAFQLPAPPNKSDLLEFYVSGIATQVFAVDAKSVSVGEDGVVRYTLVGRSASGAENISYEGIRCESFEKKLYAFGHKDGSWSRSRRDQWQRISNTLANRQHGALARDYLCSHKVVAGSAEEIVARIREQHPTMHSIGR
jgi:hypothetical protein